MNKKFIFFFLATLSSTTIILAKKTSLHLASFYGNAALLQTLINRQIYDIEEQDDYGQTPLHYAALFGHLDCLKFLIHCRATIDLQDNKLWTPLHHAARCGHLECVQYLVEHSNANIYAKTNKSKTPIDVAREIFKSTRLAKIKTIQYLKTIEQVRQETQELMDIDIS